MDCDIKVGSKVLYYRILKGKNILKNSYIIILEIIII